MFPQLYIVHFKKIYIEIDNYWFRNESNIKMVVSIWMDIPKDYTLWFKSGNT